MSEISIVTTIPLNLSNFTTIEPIEDIGDESDVTKCRGCLKIVSNKGLLRHIANKQKEGIC